MVAETAAIAGLVAKLFEVGVAEWRKKDAGRRCLLSIVSALRAELDQNWSALQKAYRSVAEVSLASRVWEQSAPALGAALADAPFLLSALEQAYSHTSQPIPRSDRGHVVEAWSDVGRALGILDEFSERETLSRWKPNEYDCRHRGLGELLAGLPNPVNTEYTEVWIRWLAAIGEGRYKPFTVDEVNLVRSYREPLREAEFRAEARAEWGDNHCFELESQIFEFWIEPGWRFLFTTIEGRPRPLVLVRLTGHEVEGWSPKRPVELARCRRQSLMR